MQTDYLIVGQGLAGSLLAWQLIRRNCKVIIVDTGQENASQVAAGIINPITGLRFVKSDDIDVLLPSAIACYAELSGFFRQAFYIEKPMLRIFRNAAEAKIALTRLNNPDYHTYLSTANATHEFNNVSSPFGSMLQKQTGHLLTLASLKCLKDFFIAQDCYRRAVFNFTDLQTQPSLCWQGLLPAHIIFCEGYHVARNPWFSWLPLQPVKGETLTLCNDTDLPNTMLNYGNWLLPLGNQQFRIGASFDRENINTLPTELGRLSLVNNLKVYSSNLAAATLIQHQANIRPCTLDRHPFIGQHPQNPKISVFNGFGAKGSLQIPWYSQQLADHLQKDTALNKSCHIQRYYTSHFSAA
ncbi:MAG: FAD-binding oxidoreductase [Methylococcales bacterium]